MGGIVQNLWLIPVLPLLAAGIIAVTRQPHRTLAASLAIGSMGVSFLISCAALVTTLGQGKLFREFHNFSWFQIGETSLKLGWVLDPLTAAMLVMVTFVGLLIFIYSVGYMAHDENFTRFFGFLALFAAAMLGIIIANSLLLLFISWELVGLASYILIGFWYHKPSAAAAAKKAFIVTRIGDIGFFVGMLWLYSETGTLLFYDNGQGCLEQSALARLVIQTTGLGMAVSTAIALLIFCGAVGKSGQVPLHVWLPDAMEGPTPVSALIHAATMVAAGVFLVARVYPLMSAQAVIHQMPAGSAAIQVVTWVGAVTAVFAACVAVAQNDIKRILAYSTVSQLGYMMMGLGVGGVAVGMFHLITHAFFKALLFMGAGSVIHGCHEEQDIRRMGGLRRFMPVTFVTYAVGMMALAGVPVFFAGFWSKDEILHAAHAWPASHGPFYLGLFGALLTAFYMTRQVCLVFFGNFRGAEHSSATGHVPDGQAGGSHSRAKDHGKEQSPKSGRESLPPSHPTVGRDSVEPWNLGGRKSQDSTESHPTQVRGKARAASRSVAAQHPAPHESPLVMTVPLVILAGFAMALGFLGTPAWPWFQEYLTGAPVSFHFGKLFEWDVLSTMLLSTSVVAVGIGLGWWFYGRRPVERADALDPLEQMRPETFAVLRGKFFVDELYDATVVRLNAGMAWFADWLDYWIWNGAVQCVSYLVLGISWISRIFDEWVINGGFDEGCRRITQGGKVSSEMHSGQVQQYLRVIGVALTVLVLLLTWGCGK